MLPKKFLILFICFLPFAANAQFYSNGQITYERKFDLKLAVQLEDNYK